MAFQPVTAEEAHRLYQTGLLWVRTNGRSQWAPFDNPTNHTWPLEAFEQAYDIGDGYCCALLLED